MRSDLTKRIIEAAGFVGVIGSLIFVGIEVRQNSIATRAAMNAEVKHAFQEHNMMVASSPELAAAWARSAADPENATPEDAFLVLAMWRSLFHIWANAHRQHLNGTLDPAIFEAVVQEIRMYSGNLTDQSMAKWTRNANITRQFQWAWGSERYVYNPEFQAFIDGMANAKE